MNFIECFVKEFCETYLVGLGNIFAGNRNVVKFSIALDTVTLSTVDGEIGHGQEQLPTEIDGEPVDVAFNVKYLLEGLRAMTSTQVMMQLNSALAQTVFIPVGTNDDWRYLIIPVQLKSVV